MKKFIKRFGMILAGLVVVVGLCILVAAGWFMWQLHPWVASGQAFDLGHWQFGDCEFQVWQRKNVFIFEPFADGLFVRQGTNEWQAFCFDIQDSYSPRVRLQKEDSQVVIYRDGEKRGIYDLATHTFRRHEQPFTPEYIGSKPPGDWWLRK